MITDPRPDGSHHFSYPALDDILAARDHRVALRRELLQDEGNPVLVQLSVALPAELRQDRKVSDLCQAAALRFERAVRASGWSSRLLHSGQGVLGPWVLWSVAGSAAKPERVKLLCVRLEEENPCDRILDFDVEIPGRCIDRGSLGMPPRVCPVCGGEASLCSGRAVHPRDHVISAYAGLLRNAGNRSGQDMMW